MNEIWKDIKGYEGLYKVSSFGRVLNVKRKTIRKLDKLKNGHYQVRLCKNNTYTNFLIHRLVYETFLGTIPNGYICHHINEDGLCNNIDNLVMIQCGEHQRLHRLESPKCKDIVTGRFIN